MIAFYIFSLLIFTAYLSGVIARYGVPPSVSETFYLLPKRLGWLFTGFCWGVSFCLLPFWFEAAAEGSQFLAFLSASGLLFVGAAPMFKTDYVKRVHYVAALVCITASQLWIMLFSGLWWVSLICFALAGAAILKDRQKGLFWVELAAFVSTYIAVIAV